jgi:hypothetical protein
MTIADRRLSRRQAIVGAGLVGGGALAAIMAAPAVAADEGQNGLEGSWLLKIVNDNGSPSNQVLILDSTGGGVAAVSDNSPASGSTGFGAWQKSGENQYLETFELFSFDASGKLAGILRIRAQSALDETGDQRGGRARLELRPVGAPDFFTVGTTHFSGSRIKPLPL